jgi:hypothetical protein
MGASEDRDSGLVADFARLGNKRYPGKAHGVCLATDTHLGTALSASTPYRPREGGCRVYAEIAVVRVSAIMQCF